MPGHIRPARGYVEIAPQEFDLILLRPHLLGLAVRAGHGIRAELGHDDRLAELLVQLVEFTASRFGRLIEPRAFVNTTRNNG